MPPLLDSKRISKENGSLRMSRDRIGVHSDFILFSCSFPDHCEVQLSKPTFGNQKMKSARRFSSSEKPAQEGFAIFDHFNLHLYLHNTLV